MTDSALKTLKKQLSKLISQGDLYDALVLLREAMPEQVAKYGLVFQLLTRHNRANGEKLKGVLSFEQAERLFNQITSDLLDLINGLEARDFQAEGNASRAGEILYKVPKEMSVGVEERCVVRLAFEQGLTVQGIELEGAVVKPVRISEVMEVNMLDPNSEPAFNIRALNSAEQFVERGDYSEWIFMLSPLRTGKLPLLLKVTVVELVQGRERKKEIVLEELIQVHAQPAPKAEAAPPVFQSSGYYLTASHQGGAQAEKAPVANSYFYFTRAVASFALLLVVGLGLWAFGFREYRAWRQAEQAATPSAYEQYLANYPSGKHQTEARENLDRLYWEDIQQHPDDSLPMLAYLNRFETGRYEMEVRQMLEALRSERAKPEDTTSMANDTLIVDTLLPSQPPSQSRRRPNKPSVQSPKPPRTPPTPEERSTPAEEIPPTEELPATKEEEAPPDPAPDPPLERAVRSGFELVPIAGGTFSMGSSAGDADECPHEQRIAQFRIGRYEVTQADWQEVMGSAPAYFSGCAECPVEQVSWNDAQAFIQKANELKGTRYRLPTEAEWEYAARAGTEDRFAGGGGIARFGWYHGNAQRTQRVGSKQPNGWGLYDMTGNVWEWCQDNYGPYPGCKGNVTQRKVLRGGSWRNREADCRTTARKSARPQQNDYTMGLRLAHPW